MANVKVRLKDASNNVLHPETDWSVVLNRPSFDRVANGNGYFTQKWNASAKSDDVEIDGDVVNIYSKDTSLSLTSFEDMFLASGANIEIGAANVGNIKIKDRNTSNKYITLDQYPIKWSAISDKPKYIPTDARDITFGSYSTVTNDHDGTGYYGMIYPAIRTINYSSNPSGDNYGYTFYYFNGTSWTKFTDGSKFFPGF